ncbi:glycosyltransferase [Virgisporangium ochraceum]|uniref:Glycosyl transferase n=1 Tax=Virgisporangium ochraceum TaxID=65505 RepID=A0A8J3ZQ63_9ACTN|nr:glycosyltransferase [Virgisporangium ochraceum]GIJ68147.1 glycosyl transferase [Virgisporangium ochraceum]
MSTAVLHVAQPVDGGVAAYVLAACLDQVARGWRVTVACPDGGRLAASLATAGIPRVNWNAGRGPGRGSVGEARRLAAIVERQRPDALHLHASKAGLAGRLRTRFGRRLPTLFQPHGWSWLAVDGRLRTASVAWERAAARWTDLFVCVGAAEAEAGREQRVAGRYTVVRNGVDRGRYTAAGPDGRAAARHRLGLDPVAPLAVCVGRVTRQKGQDVLLAAWPAVVHACAGARLALVGDGDLLGHLNRGVHSGVTFAGNAADVRPWLAAADVVVLPSRWEGLPLTVLEAFATGRSVVASRVPGLAETVPSSVGALVPPDDPAALADALARRLGDPARCRVEGEAAATHAARYDLRHTFDRLAAATETAIHRGSIHRGQRR